MVSAGLLFYGGTYMSFFPPELKRFDLTLFFLNTILLPLVFLRAFRRLGVISSWQLTTRRERRWPLLTYTLLLAATWVVLRRVRQPLFLTEMVLAYAATALLTWLATFRWKVSLHLAGWGSFSAVMLAVTLQLTPSFVVFWLLSLPLAGLTATARLVLQQHRPGEVYAAFLGAFAVAFAVMML